MPDEKVLERATQLARAVLTMNRRDFARLHTSQSEHAGIVLCKYEMDFGGQASRIDEAVQSFVDLNSQLVRVQKPVKQKSE